MSDDNSNNEDFGALTNDDDDSGFGNLPPLSDFDSSEGDDSGGGLPPIVDIKVDTPAVRPSDLDIPESNPAGNTPGGGFDTPAPGGLGFQDFAADSDFSPETPDIGSGPDSDIETPMFDSAFGGNTDDFSTPGAGGTPAPTQAMETPMFEAAGTGSGGFGFDNYAFGVPTPAGAGATPIPDFSPDTGANAAHPVNYGGGDSGGGGKGAAIAAGIVMLIVGLAVGGYFTPKLDLGFVPNPARDEVAAKAKKDIAAKDSTIRQKDGIIEEKNKQLSDGNIYTQEKVDELKEDTDRLTAEIEGLDELKRTAIADEAAAQTALEKKNEALATATDDLEETKKSEAISNARNQGLKAENSQLVNAVGELEDANNRRQATLDTLIHNVNLLEVQIQSGSPLAPQRYSHKSRLNKVDALSNKVSRAKWVTPQLLNEYTDLYVAELGIASSREYFFAKIPVHDSLGTKYDKWAECLMNGNWSIYDRTLDGLHVGSYENTSPTGSPKFAFREELPEELKADIVSQVSASRPEDYEAKFLVLMGKEAIHNSDSKIQKKFSSLLK